jgi:predicted branched-subunit amino acid permease
LSTEPSTVTFGRPGRGSLLLAAAPLGAAIGVFGVIYGAAASAEMDAAMALCFSLLVFSGTLQFATVGLLVSGAGVLPIVLTALALNTRHVVLGAVLRPYIGGSRLRRALMAWFLLDESFALAVASRQRAGFVLVVGGVIFYLSWQLGTVLGLLGAQAAGLAGLAAAVFPVLFIGLCTLTIRHRGDVVRVLLAAIVVVAISQLVPEADAFAPVLAAITVALLGRQSS